MIVTILFSGRVIINVNGTSKFVWEKFKYAHYKVCFYTLELMSGISGLPRLQQVPNEETGLLVYTCRIYPVRLHTASTKVLSTTTRRMRMMRRLLWMKSYDSCAVSLLRDNFD